MRLSYRGGHYDYTPPTLEVTESEILGQYRGRPWRCHTLESIPVPQPAADMVYRGTAYTVGKPATRPVAAKRVTVTGTQPGRLTQAPHVLDELEQVHRASMYRTLERRIAAAKARGDERLLGMLEAERHQLV